MKQQLTNIIDNAVRELNLTVPPYSIEHPQIESHGDYAANIAMVLFPLLEKQGNQDFGSPRQLAQTLVESINQKLEKSPDFGIQHVSVAGPGFINIFISPNKLVEEMSNIVQNRQTYGTSEANKGKTIIVEYSSPNIAKPFTIGHLRSTVIGDAIANLKAATGWKVYRDNHLGDWGTQFGKLIYAIKTWGNEKELDQAVNPVKLLVDLYVKFHQEAEGNPRLEDEGRYWFKELENGDLEAKRIWSKCISWSWKEFSRIYKLLGIEFSPEMNNGMGFGESFFEDKMTPVISELRHKNLLQTGENGAELVFFPEDKYPPLMILKKDGATLYATRDLATDKYRKSTFNPDIILNEVGAEQSLYFNQLFETEQLLGWFKPGQRIHVGHGLYRFAEGKMSTRKGNVIWLEEVLSEAMAKAIEIMDRAVKREKQDRQTETNLGLTIGIGALKWNDLKGDPLRVIEFNWDEILNMKGNSGPYIQYTFARTRSVLEKGRSLSEVNLDFPGQINPEELSILRWLYRYPETITLAEATNSPSTLANYLYELAKRYNSFYNMHPILGNPDHPVSEPVSLFRQKLTDAAGQILKNGLKILGIETPERM